MKGKYSTLYCIVMYNTIILFVLKTQIKKVGQEKYMENTSSYLVLLTAALGHGFNGFFYFNTRSCEQPLFLEWLYFKLNFICITLKIIQITQLLDPNFVWNILPCIFMTVKVHCIKLSEHLSFCNFFSTFYIISPQTSGCFPVTKRYVFARFKLQALDALLRLFCAFFFYG